MGHRHRMGHGHDYSSQGRAFFVLGPESSGTRLATEILLNAGCYGSSDHIQSLDHLLDIETEDERKQFINDLVPLDTSIVWRRSIPHNTIIPSISGMSAAIYPRKPHIIITVRDPYCIVQSQLNNHQHAK